MKTAKIRILTMVASLGLLLIAPMFLGAVSTSEQPASSYEACASTNEEDNNCCEYSAICRLGSQNYTGYELYDGPCSKRDKEEEEEEGGG